MSVYGNSDFQILKDLGIRLKKTRLNKNISQKELAEQCGIHRNTIGDIEKGKPYSILTLISVLRALNKLEILYQILPEPSINPMKLAKLKGKERKHASGERKKWQKK